VPALDVLERVQDAPCEIHRVLDGDEVLARELLVRQQVPPELGLDAQLINGLVAEDVAAGLDGHDVRGVGEGFVEHRALVLAVRVFVEGELGEVLEL